MSEHRDLATALRAMAPASIETHYPYCWMYHRGCAMTYAAEVLEQSEPYADGIEGRRDD